jgi:hypothetical protein
MPRFSASLDWLAIRGRRIVRESSDTAMLLRGVNRSGLEYSDPGREGFLASAGLTETEADAICGDWGANIVRLPFNQDWALRGRGGFGADDYRAALDQAIAWYAARGAYTLLDLQWLNADTPYGADNFVPPLPIPESLEMWAQLAERYRDEPAVLFDVFNEPHNPQPDDPYPMVTPEGYWIESTRVTAREWRPWAEALVDAIHAVHRRALVFVSGLEWGYDLRGFPVDREQVVYSSHVYPERGRAWEDGFGRLARTHPVFAGEWGGAEADRPWGEELAAYFNELEIGWTAWSWCDRPHLQRGGAPTPFGDLVKRKLRSLPERQAGGAHPTIGV